MPLYRFQDKETGYEVEVMRDYEQYRTPPTEEELPESERGKERNWIKLIAPGIRVVRGAGWSGQKGRWVVLLAAVASHLTSPWIL